MKTRTEARREAIISEATILFCEMGYERASMSELAKRLGGSKATLYGYFPSKEELLVAVAETIGKDLLDLALRKLEEPEGRDFKDLLHCVGETMMTLTNKSRGLEIYRMVISESGRSDIGQLFFETGPKRVCNGIRDRFIDAIERGILRPCDAGVAARHFLALINAENEERLFQHAPRELTKAQVRDQVSRAVDVFMKGYEAG